MGCTFQFQQKILYQNKIIVNCVLFKKGHSQPLFLYFCLFKTDERRQANNEISNINVCQCLDSNHEPLAQEAIALPTELQPLPYRFVVLSNCNLDPSCTYAKTGVTWLQMCVTYPSFLCGNKWSPEQFESPSASRWSSVIL